MRLLSILIALVALASIARADYWTSVEPIPLAAAQPVHEDSGDVHSYAAHYESAKQSGDLLVLVTSDGCHHCEVLKGVLNDMGVKYAVVNYSTHPALAKRIGSSTYTPELVHYVRKDGRWIAYRTTGSRTRSQLKLFFEQRVPPGAYDGSIRLPGPSHALRGTMCGSRGCQMCVGIALRRVGLTPIGRSHQQWLNQYDNYHNLKAFTASSGAVADYGETPPDAIRVMLDMAELSSGETLYDLGSGDGRIAIAAARDYGARAIGYELDGELVEIARQAAQGVRQYIRFEQCDAIGAPLDDADVIAMYLTGNVTSKLLPQFADLPPDVRIVAFEFPLPGITPVATRRVGDRTVYLYRTPLRRIVQGESEQNSGRRDWFPGKIVLRSFASRPRLLSGISCLFGRCSL